MLRQTIHTILALLMLTGCSAMLVGGGTSNVPQSTPTMSSQERALADRVAQALAGNSSLSNIKVSADGSAVTLSGMVSSFADRDRALRIAKDVKGVSRVDNQIAVNTGG